MDGTVYSIIYNNIMKHYIKLILYIRHILYIIFKQSSNNFLQEAIYLFVYPERVAIIIFIPSSIMQLLKTFIKTFKLYKNLILYPYNIILLIYF